MLSAQKLIASYHKVPALCGLPPPFVIMGVFPVSNIMPKKAGMVTIFKKQGSEGDLYGPPDISFPEMGMSDLPFVISLVSALQPQSS